MRGYVRPSKCRGVPGVVLVLPHVVPGVWVKMQRLGMKPRSLGLLAPESLIFQGSRVFLGGKKKKGIEGGGALMQGVTSVLGTGGGCTWEPPGRSCDPTWGLVGPIHPNVPSVPPTDGSPSPQPHSSARWRGAGR